MVYDPLAMPGMRASSARSAASGFHRDASALSMTWFGLLMPVMTLATAGSAARPPIATLSSDTPRASANAWSLPMTCQSACKSRSGWCSRREPDGAGLSYSYLPVSRPDASGW